WERNAGLRIDHLLLSDELAPRLVDANVDRWVRGQPRASDHAPVWVELADRESSFATPAEPPDAAARSPTRNGKSRGGVVVNGLARAAAVASACVVWALAGAQTLSTQSGPVNVESLARLEHPWGMEFLPDGRLLITEKPGRLRVFAEGKLS